MGKRMKLPLLSHSKSLDPKLLSPSSPWGLPSCGHTKTLSFRATANAEDDDITPLRTFNSVFLEEFSPPPRPFSTMSEYDPRDPVEVVIHGLRSDRFFFEPEPSSSLMEEREEEEGRTEDESVVEYKESEMFWIDSLNPYEDFKRSMEEMVKAHGLMKDWEGLGELLGCYLKINGKNNHGYILSAFIDLLVSFPFASLEMPSSSSTSTTTTTSNSLSSSTSIVYSSPSSPLSLPSSSLTTPSLSSILDHHGDDEHDGDHDVSS